MKIPALLLSLAMVFAYQVAADTASPTPSPTRIAKARKGKKAKKSKKKSARSHRKVTQKKAPAGKTADSELKTDVKFNDSVLYGQYQTPEEALVKVEDEKGLNDLLGVRKNFKDRLDMASAEE